MKRYEPRFLAILGIGAFRLAFAKPEAVIGEQPERIGSTVVWVLPNPSGLNAHYPPVKLVEEFKRLERCAAGEWACAGIPRVRCVLNGCPSSIGVK